MRQYEWFKRWRNEDRSDEQEEQTNGRRGSGTWGRIKDLWSANGEEAQRPERRERATKRYAVPARHGLF